MARSEGNSNELQIIIQLLANTYPRLAVNRSRLARGHPRPRQDWRPKGSDLETNIAIKKILDFKTRYAYLTCNKRRELWSAFAAAPTAQNLAANAHATT